MKRIRWNANSGRVGKAKCASGASRLEQRERLAFGNALTSSSERPIHLAGTAQEVERELWAR